MNQNLQQPPPDGLLGRLGFTNSREWVYPLAVKGQFSSYHRVSSGVLFLILMVGPWLRWNGDPLFLADLPTRRLLVLGTIFTPSDGVLIMLGALTAAFLLFFFTSVFGRLWCGYACPQSVFQINVVLPIERWLEGSRGVRRRRDKGPWNWDKTSRKLAKWSIYMAFAFFVSMSFMGFFERTELLWTGRAGSGDYSVVAFFTFIWFLDFAWFREQVCNYVCPYARFQGALTDDESLVITYDIERGEPRGKAAKAVGGCIDCNKCVVVCPQGIDIRDGFQLECIACGRCIDACTSVMDKLGHPTLVRYSTEAADRGEPTRLFRGRTIIYSVLLTGLVSAMAFTVFTRSDLEVMVDRSPGSLFIHDDDGYIRNTYLVNVSDRSGSGERRVFAVAVEGLPEGSQVRARPIILEPGERIKVPVIVRIPEAASHATIPLTVVVRGKDFESAVTTSFKGPQAEGDR